MRERARYADAILVAAILLVFISILAGGILMIYMTREIGAVKNTNPDNEIGAVLIEKITYASRDKLKIVVRNIGSTTITIDSAYLYDEKNEFIGIMYPTLGPVSLEPGHVKEIEFTPNELITRDYKYVKIHGDNFVIAVELVDMQ